MVFKDRVDAGVKLAEALKKYEGADTIVLAIPRGGVVVGFQVATELGVPLDVIVPRKIGAPGEPELAIGAIGENVVILDEETINFLDIPESYIKEQVEQEKAEMARRMLLYRGSQPFPELAEKTVILVDDGVATGLTDMAAVAMIREKKPGAIVLAVPVGAPDSIAKLAAQVDDIVVLATPEPFLSVGYWYTDFWQTTDDMVIDLLRQAKIRLTDGGRKN